MKKTLLVVPLLFISLPSYAWFLAPSNKSECIKKYALNTNTDFAAKYMQAACFSYFREYTLSDYLEYDNPRYARLAINKDDTSVYAAFDKHEKKWVKITRAEIDEIEKEFDQYVRKQKQQAKCVLESSDLRNAKNDWAAKLALSESGCYKR